MRIMLFDKEGQIYTDNNGTQWRIGQQIYLNPAWCDDGKIFNPTPFHLYHFMSGKIAKIWAYKNAPVKVGCLMYLKPKDIELTLPLETICQTKPKEDIPVKAYDLPLMGVQSNEKGKDSERSIEKLKAMLFDLATEIDSRDLEHLPENHPLIKKLMMDLYQIIFDITCESNKSNPSLSIDIGKTMDGYNGVSISMEGDTIVFRTFGDPKSFQITQPTDDVPPGCRVYRFDPAVTFHLENCHCVIIPKLPSGNIAEIKYDEPPVFKTGEIRPSVFTVRQSVGASPLRENIVIGKLWIPEWPKM